MFRVSLYPLSRMPQGLYLSGHLGGIAASGRGRGWLRLPVDPSLGDLLCVPGQKEGWLKLHYQEITI